MCYPCSRSELLPMSPVAQGGGRGKDTMRCPHVTNCYWHQAQLKRIATARAALSRVTMSVEYRRSAREHTERNYYDPHPQPLPPRGRGAHRVCGTFEHSRE